LAQTPRSKFAEVNGVKLHYLMVGKGDPVVLLHTRLLSIDRAIRQKPHTTWKPSGVRFA
jgi:hypothetical protein